MNKYSELKQLLESILISEFNQWTDLSNSVSINSWITFKYQLLSAYNALVYEEQLKVQQPKPKVEEQDLTKVESL